MQEREDDTIQDWNNNFIDNWDKSALTVYWQVVNTGIIHSVFKLRLSNARRNQD